MAVELGSGTARDTEGEDEGCAERILDEHKIPVVWCGSDFGSQKLSACKTLLKASHFPQTFLLLVSDEARHQDFRSDNSSFWASLGSQTLSHVTVVNPWRKQPVFGCDSSRTFWV